MTYADYANEVRHGHKDGPIEDRHREDDATDDAQAILYTFQEPTPAPIQAKTAGIAEDIDGIPCYHVRLTIDAGRKHWYTRHTETHLTIGAGKTQSAARREGQAYINRHGMAGIMREIKFRIQSGWTPPAWNGSPLVGKDPEEIAEIYTRWTETQSQHD